MWCQLTGKGDPILTKGSCSWGGVDLSRVMASWRREVGRMVSCSIMTGLLRTEVFQVAMISAGVGDEEEEECLVIRVGWMEERGIQV